MIDYVCPKCGKPDELYEDLELTAWRSIDRVEERDGQPLVHIGSEREAEWWRGVERVGYGCSCGWEGLSLRRRNIGIDGEEIPEPIKGQEGLEV